MNHTHMMMPEPSHDERSEQYFVCDLKTYLLAMGPTQKAIADRAASALASASGKPAYGEVREAMLQQGAYSDWLRFRRASQEMMWEAIASSVDRQIGALSAKAKIEQPKGSLQLDPNFVAPAYISSTDVHMMPGGYMQDRGEADIRQGAIMDRGGAVYLLGRNGGAMNDGRGDALVSHVFDRAPTIAPRRTLEMSCGVGASTAAVAAYFPEAENWGIDLGAALLRYAHARAEDLDLPIHFAQRDAEHTGFPGDHFDLVYSCAVLHETSPEAVAAIISEAQRILRPGGLMVHLEVPSCYENGNAWDQLQGEFEHRYDNEPFWEGANTLDYAALLRKAGFADVMVGYQAKRPRAERGNRGFRYAPAARLPAGSWCLQ